MATGSKHKMVGRILKNRMKKTVVVEVSRRILDARYKKYVQKRSRYKAHDENNECRLGDLVEIIQSRPLSKDKHWTVSRIVERAVEV